jgi:hypothetical protein
MLRMKVRQKMRRKLGMRQKKMMAKNVENIYENERRFFEFEHHYSL